MVKEEFYLELTPRYVGSRLGRAYEKVWASRSTKVYRDPLNSTLVVTSHHGKSSRIVMGGQNAETMSASKMSLEKTLGVDLI